MEEGISDIKNKNQVMMQMEEERDLRFKRKRTLSESIRKNNNKKYKLLYQK